MKLSSMWGPVCLLWMFAWTVIGAPSMSTVCPENCECFTTQSGLKAHCSSLDFLSKLRPKQIQEITELDVSDLAMKTVDSKLRKLRNLQKLDISNNELEDLKNFPQLSHLTHLYLSHNRIEVFTASDLPKSVKHLDLSSNRITVLTDISKFLPNLREINLNENILMCECDFLKYRDALLRNDVHIVRPANCYKPENLHGISLLSAYCVFGKVTYDDLGQMLADEPGSGEDVSALVAASTSSDFLGFDATENEAVPDDDDLDREYFRTNIDTNSSLSESSDESIEGSGSYIDVTGGSGDGAFVPVSPDPEVPHCYYNCSTPAPSNDTSTNEPPGSIGQELLKIFGDLTGESSSSTTTTTTSSPLVKEVEQQKSSATLQEIVSKERPSENDNIRAAVDAPKESQAKEDVSKKNNTTTYVIVAVLFAAMVVMVVYVVIRRRRSARPINNRRPASNHEIKEIPPPVEMKPLMTPTPRVQTFHKPNPVQAERRPLMNGQNGTNKKGDDEHPVKDETDAGKAPPVENGLDVPEDDEPQVRPKKEDDALLTPGTKRVTIQAKELSSPKSPVLVHRHVGDDGKIISSPVSNNEFKYT
ncbi:hypothetical protein AMK59_3775 [Oryctes borbonicus]|uniref:LRRCT domain-containing protein n=1 Tax=Oryctes borbonicus TaxID=1629725 RepID=A0A0T6B653_9SCAR|nr:hypothetical protein AMK59_3775 [Oryctes borbonicus]